MNGEWVEEPKEVKEKVHNFFSERFKEQRWTRPKLMRRILIRYPKMITLH